MTYVGKVGKLVHPRASCLNVSRANTVNINTFPLERAHINVGASLPISVYLSPPYNTYCVLKSIKGFVRLRFLIVEVPS
jgi:hypothetical protein